MTGFEALQLNLDRFLVFTLVLTRMSGLVMTAPIFGTREVPLQVRGLLAFVASLLVMPTQWSVPLASPPTLIHYALLVGSELLVGLCLGLGIDILFSGIHLAGQVIGQMSGLMLADVYDPTLEDSFPIFSKLLFLVTMAVFVCIGGHRLVMAGLLDTFRTIPPGQAALPEQFIWTLESLVTQSFALALRASAPACASLLLVTVVLALIGRTLPQLNVLALGFGVNAVATFGVLAVSLGAAAWVFQAELEPAITALLEALHTPVSQRWLP